MSARHPYAPGGIGHTGAIQSAFDRPPDWEIARVLAMPTAGPTPAVTLPGVTRLDDNGVEKVGAEFQQNAAGVVSGTIDGSIALDTSHPKDALSYTWLIRTLRGTTWGAVVGSPPEAFDPGMLGLHWLEDAVASLTDDAYVAWGKCSEADIGGALCDGVFTRVAFTGGNRVLSAGRWSNSGALTENTEAGPSDEAIESFSFISPYIQKKMRLQILGYDPAIGIDNDEIGDVTGITAASTADWYQFVCFGKISADADDVALGFTPRMFPLLVPFSKWSP